MANATINTGVNNNKEEKNMNTNVVINYSTSHKGFSAIEGICGTLYNLTRFVGNMVDTALLQIGAEVHNQRLNTMGATYNLAHNAGVTEKDRRGTHKEMFLNGKIGEEIIRAAGRTGLVGFDAAGNLVKNYEGDMLDEVMFRVNAAHDIVDAKTGETVKMWNPMPETVQAVIAALAQKANRAMFFDKAETANDAAQAETANDAAQAETANATTFVYGDGKTYPKTFVCNGVTHSLDEEPFYGDKDMYMDAYFNLAMATPPQQPSTPPQQPSTPPQQPSTPPQQPSTDTADLPDDLLAAIDAKITAQQQQTSEQQFSSEFLTKEDSDEGYNAFE